MQSCMSSQAILSDSEEISALVINSDSDSDFIIEGSTSDVVVSESFDDKISEISSSHIKTEDSVYLDYQVKKSETLMLIAFNIYGDYRLWRVLYSLNKNVIGDNFDLSHLPIIRYKRPVRAYTPPQGNPYLIKSGDSLSLISKKVYGNWREWPELHKNNLDQIRDPNLIFAGFTIFYRPLSKLALDLH